ncbi:MAG: hypothetical protein CL797_07305, partial [Chromatiales bacterium]|nr:hypothetical protein [Chromatiales bacterium]
MKFNQWLTTLGICFVIFVGLSFQPALAQIDRHYGDGSDGDLTVTSTTYTDSIKTTVSGTNSSGQNTLTVVSSSGFEAGDEILIISSLGSSAGKYETQRVALIEGARFTFHTNLNHSYDNSSDAVHQVIRVPQYETVTINSGSLTCADWNGTNGGVVFFRANDEVIINSGTINADYKGYRGGQYTSGQDSPRHSGEGTMGQKSETSRTRGEALSNGGGTPHYYA